MPEIDINKTAPVPAGVPFDPSKQVVGLVRTTREARFIPPTEGPPLRIDGYNVGAPLVTGPSPHAGEMHPDGDELLFVLSGRMNVTLELEDGDREVELGQGEALVVPRGTWHLITTVEPGQIIHVTPGPNGEGRPLARA